MLEVEIKWNKRLLQKYNRWNLAKWVAIWITKSVIFLHSVAVPRTPIDTWILRKWYREQSLGLVWKIYNKTKYAKFVSEWTKFQKANPFLENTKKFAEPHIEKIINNEIKKQLW